MDLELRLSDDTAVGLAERRVRDAALVPAMRRNLGAAAPQSHNGGGQAPYAPAALLRAWLAALRPPAEATPGAKLDRSLAGTALALAGLGLALGGSGAAALLAYDGSHPVNVLNFLAVFVGAQLLTFLFLLTQALPGGVLRPRAGQIPPSLLHRGLRSFLRGRLRAAPAFGRMFAPVEAWQLLAFTQLFGVAFNLAALAVTVGTVTVSDVAFSWSTTLDVDAAKMLRLVQIIAAPWAWLLPDAVPTATLVEASQYFRLKSAGAGTFALPGATRLYGGWWPFLAASVACYGLLPRALLLLAARHRGAAARRRVLRGNLELERLAAHINDLLFMDQPAALSGTEAPGDTAMRTQGTTGDAAARTQGMSVDAARRTHGTPGDAVAQGQGAPRDTAAQAQGKPRDPATLTQGTLDAAAQAQGTLDAAAQAQGTLDAAAQAQGTLDASARTPGDAAARTPGTLDATARTLGEAAARTQERPDDATMQTQITLGDAAARTRGTSGGAARRTQGTSGDAATRSAAEGGAAANATSKAAAKRSPVAGPCGAVLWRDLPFGGPELAPLIQQVTGAPPAFVRHAGGTQGDLDGAGAAGAVRNLGKGAGAVVVVDVFAALDKALRHFLGGLRALIGPGAPILIVPVGGAAGVPEAPRAAGDDAKLGLWRRAVRDLGDPATILAELP